MEINILKNKPFFIAELYEILRSVIDPELGLNIVDLGLIYAIEVPEGQKEINVTMTLSTKGCPAGDFIINSIGERLKHRYPDWEIDVNLIWEPEWTVDNISAQGKIQLGLN